MSARERRHLLWVGLWGTGFARAALAAAPLFGPQTPDARPVSFISPTAAVIHYTTATPVPTRVQLRSGSFPADTPGHEDAWDAPRVIAGAPAPTTEHALMIDDLEPATRYYYRVYDPGAEVEKPGEWAQQAPWAREYAFATQAARGETSFVRIPIKVLLVPNVINLSTVTPDTPQPEPMSAEELALYKQNFEQAALFYWVNSRMRYWLDCEYFIDPEWQRRGAEREDLPAFYQGWPAVRDGLKVFDPEEIDNHAAAAPLKDDRIWTGQVIVLAERRWNADQQRWYYQGSGGGTFGIDWMTWGDATQRPAPGRSTFLGGSDQAWLLTHEFHHQRESQYNFSGLRSEDDRVVFCHFAPRYRAPHSHWRWDTAFAHGEHWDGIAWALRMSTDAQYFRNVFGEIATAADADHDGIPDADPRLPLDERRFGSSSETPMTDGRTPDLAKVMQARWVPTPLTNLREKVYNPGYVALWELASGERLADPDDAAGYRAPDPTRVDADGDGVPDRDDPYPIYPWAPVIRAAEIAVDGELDEWDAIEAIGHVKAAGVDCTLKTAHDVDHLYYAVEITGDFTSLMWQIDNDADGWYVGNDNLQIVVERPAAGTPTLRQVVAHLASNRTWPHFDTGDPIRWTHRESGQAFSWERPKRFGGVEDVTFAASRDGDRVLVELALPNGSATLPIKGGPGHPIGVAFYVRFADHGPLSLYQPYELFQTTWE
jgi:hypothetical protein